MTLRSDLIEAFGWAAIERDADGKREALDAAVDFLIITMMQHLGRPHHRSASEVDPIVKAFADALRRAVAAALVQGRKLAC
jgi:hypothetical protein